MSSISNDKLQILWDHFIRADNQSNEKSTWLDVFLAEILAQVKEGRDVKDALSFCSLGGGGVTTLIACELLSDVHELCDSRCDGGELNGLRNYLIGGRGWRCLSVLHLLGVRGLSCGRELVALLVALYPVAFPTELSSEEVPYNPYVRFYCNDDTVDTVEIIPYKKKKKKKREDEEKRRKNFDARGKTLLTDDIMRRRRMKRSLNYQQIGKSPTKVQKQDAKKLVENGSSESEEATDGIDHARSLTLKIRLNPMDFEYFTSVIRSDEETYSKIETPPSNKSSTNCLASKKISEHDYIDERVAAVLDCKISPFEASLLIIQLLQGLRDYDTPTEQTPAVQVLKFTLDTLWALQFGNDSENLTGTECATLKAAAARLMLTALERVLRADEPTNVVIHNGLLPMTLRLLEDACIRPVIAMTPEEGSLMQEFIFATMYAVITFLYCLLHQRGTSDKLKEFLELFQLFTESLDGRLIEKTILAIVELPSTDPTKSVTRAWKVIDMIGALISALKRVRQILCHMGQCRRLKHKSCSEDVESHHHFDVFGVPYYVESAVVVAARGSLTKQVCCISSLFMTLTTLLKDSAFFSIELQVRLLKIITAAGTCCCFPPKILLSNIVMFLKESSSQTYGPAIALLERALFKDLGVYPNTVEVCNTCSVSSSHSWEFLNLYAELLNSEDSKLCHVVMAHLLKVTPNSCFFAKQDLLFGVFYPTFLKAKSKKVLSLAGVATKKFLVQSCMSAISSLIINSSAYERFMEKDGLDETLELLVDPTLAKSAYALLEICMIMEIKKMKSDIGVFEKQDRPALKAMLTFLEKETESLIAALESLQNSKVDTGNFEDIENDMGQKLNFYQASAVWRAAAGVAICSPIFRLDLVNHTILERMVKLLNYLAMYVTSANSKGSSKSAHRLMEALITCCLTTSPLSKIDVIEDLRAALTGVRVKLGRGIAVLVEALLRVSMMRPSEEQTLPQQSRPRLPTMTIDNLTDCGAGDDSSTGEYVTADDGYEADVEIQGKNLHNNFPKRNYSLCSGPDSKGQANANPALCSLAVDLLIHFSEQGLEGERVNIVTSGLRRVAVICKESASSCSALAGSGAITKILQGFQKVLSSKDLQYQDLQHATLEVFTLLATQSISSTELVSYLSLFKDPSPPLFLLLEPLFRLVLSAKPQPNFIIAFPVTAEFSIEKVQSEDVKNLEKAENLVNNFRKRHLASEICSPWSVHAICLPVGPEMAWPVWLQGCSASMWLRVERGTLGSNGRVLQTISHKHPLLDSDSDSLSDWGVLSDNWSREVVADSSSPFAPTSILHMLSIGFESLVLETWLDLKSDKLILRLTRPDDKTNRTISETSISGMLPSGNWHHLAMNFKDTVLNKHSAIVEVVIWVDGWREIHAQLPFDGLLVRKPGTTCILAGQVGPTAIGAWYLGNLMVFRCPVFTNERALYLASLGPNYTNLAGCVLNNIKPDFAPLIASGALGGVREPKFEDKKMDSNRRKSYGGTYLKHLAETKISDSKIDWDAVMDATNSHLIELQDNLLLSYEAQSPNVVHLYPQAIANPGAVVRNLFPGQPGFRVITAPEHRVSQQPPLSIPPIVSTRLQSQQYRGLVRAACLVGGVPIFLYLFARVVELNSTEEEQALALSVVLHLAHSDSELLSQYRAEGGASLILRVLESPRCHTGRHILKAIIDAACDNIVLVKDAGNGNHSISQNCEAVITDPELIKAAVEAWRTWAKYDTLNLLLHALLLLLRDLHSQREFNSAQLNRVGIVSTILTMCKEHFMYEELSVALDPLTGSAIVELVRALMGAPPEFAHLVEITDYLVLIHQASETYVTHSRHNIYFLLPPLTDITPKRSDTCFRATVSSSNESIGTLENSKLNKALTNAQIQKRRLSKRSNDDGSSQGQDTSAGEDSGIAASDGSNHQTNDRQSIGSDERRACQGLVCEGFLLLLRDALRVLPDSQVGLVLKHVLRAEVLLVLANNPDARVRTALIKVIQAYLQRGSDEETNKFIKQKYFMHLANQIALYSGSEPLVVTLENLALRGPNLAAMPPILAMIPKAAATDPNVARPLISFVTDVITKSPNILRVLLEQGLMEAIARALVNAAHKGVSVTVFRDIHVLLVAMATKLLESPGNNYMQVVSDLHTILNHIELKERSQCGIDKPCVSAARDAQVALFDGELDILTVKVSSHSGFRLKSTTAYLASASYLTSAMTTSSEHSDHGSRSSSYGSLQGAQNTVLREPGKGELNDRFRTILNRAVEFITTADEPPSTSELQLTRRLFSILLHGMSGPLGKKNHWGATWSSKPVLRKNTAKIMVWLLGPHQSNATRVYVVRSLMEEPKTHDILSVLLQVHPQVEQKFTVFLWDLLERKNEMPSADARICVELKEALRIWDLAKGLHRGSVAMWSDDLAVLGRELMRERDIWIENQLPSIQRIGNRFETLAKQITESAMTITRAVVEEQNRERKVLMEKLKYSRALEAQAMARWRDLAKRLTHERAPWHFPESYPRSWELDPTEGPARVRIRMQRCNLNIDERFFMEGYREKLEAAKVEAPLSYLFMIDRQDVNATALIERLHTSERIRKMSQARVVTPQAELLGEALIGETCFYFIPDSPDVPLHTDIALGGLDLAMAGGTVWRLEDIRELHRRRYQLQERALEIFLVTGRTYLLAFNSSKERDEFATELSNCNLPRRVPGDDLNEALALWRNGTLTNWEYVTCLNKLAGRSYNDLMQYPVFPFVLADYVSESIDLNDSTIYRNFKRPMAVQDKKNEQHYVNNYNYLKQALSEGLNLIALNQEPFHYGSHYSNSGTVLHFLVRLPPFTSMFLCYQDNNFDIPDRTFHALATTWRLTSCDSTTDVKELIPEFFYLPEFLMNMEGFNFGVRQNGNRVSDVDLPKWCGGDARIFILAHRAALEAELVREVLPFWIDLVFGFRQTGRPAVEAINVFHPATYYGFNVEQIADPLERQAWETMVKTYGQTPAQLFRAAHPLPIQNLGMTTSNNVPRVIEGINGIRWGNYVGAPGNEPVVCWKQKHRTPLASLVPLSTGDVFGLPVYSTLLLSYNKGPSMISGTSVLGAALASWNGTDGIARLKSKKEQPPRPLIKSSGLDPITILKSSPDCAQLWAGYQSGRMAVYAYSTGVSGKIEFSNTPASILLAHRYRITVIDLSRAFSVAVSGDQEGVLVIWDLNSLSYVRSVVHERNCSISRLFISETLGDIAAVYQMQDSNVEHRSELRVYTINARSVGSVLSKKRITALCYSNAPEGVSVNVIATGLENGIIRLWSSWDLRLVREIAHGNKGCGAIVAIAWSLDQHHLYAATEDSTVIIWEGPRRLSNGTPKFVNLTSL